MSGPHVGRRDFIQISLAGLIAARIPGIAVRLKLHFVFPRDRGDFLNGALLGLDEAKRTAALMGATIAMWHHENPGDLGAAHDAPLSAIIGGHDAESLAALVTVAGARGAQPVLNIAASGDELRTSHCDDAVFHVVPNESMLSAASNASSGRDASVVPWHPSLFRYGAEQLNDRYRARHRGTAGMPADAWCAWMAVKILAESALRSRASNGTELVAWMSSPRARFDGHKGVALTFDQQRQLQQPLYAVSGDGRVLSEIPMQDGAARCA